MIENKLLRDIEKEEGLIEKFDKNCVAYKHRTFIIDVFSLTDEERHVLNITVRLLRW